MANLQPTLEKQLTEASDRPKRICFVCTGNTCRSPMAAAVANALAHRELESFPEAVRPLVSPRLIAHSAGLYASPGDPISQNAVSALEGAGIPAVDGLDYHNHTARTLSESEAETYDLLIGLTREHAFSLLLQFPHLAQRITVFPTDIPDPYGGSPEVYRNCLDRIIEGVSMELFSEEDGK